MLENCDKEHCCFFSKKIAKKTFCATTKFGLKWRTCFVVLINPKYSKKKKPKNSKTCVTNGNFRSKTCFGLAFKRRKGSRLFSLLNCFAKTWEVATLANIKLAYICLIIAIIKEAMIFLCLTVKHQQSGRKNASLCL